MKTFREHLSENLTESNNGKDIYNTIKTILLDSIQGSRIRNLDMKDIGVKIVFDDKQKTIKVY